MYGGNRIDTFDEILKYIWLGIVAFAGAVTGYFTKSRNIKDKPAEEKIKLFILGVTTSMFISYITYELSLYFFHANGISVALAGLASFTGTDFAVAMEKGLLDLIQRKFRQL